MINVAAPRREKLDGELENQALEVEIEYLEVYDNASEEEGADDDDGDGRKLLLGR